MGKLRETFKIEVMPDRAQRKELARAVEAAGRLKAWMLSDLIRQYNQIGLFYSEEETFAAVQEIAAGDLLECTVRNTVRNAYAQFLIMVKEAAGGELQRAPHRRNTPLVEVPKQDVVFAVTERVVRVPYMGLVRYRPNKFISPNYDIESGPSENVTWLQQNIQRMFLGSAAAVHFILLDCRDGDESPVGPRVRKRPRKIPSILE